MLNDQTFEFSQARLQLKEALRFTARQSGNGATEYMIEDEVTGRFFRIGLAQYTFLTMLDGRRTVSTALMRTATLLREHAIDESEAASLCKWAIESGLVESETGNSAARRLEQHDAQRTQQMVSYLNPLMMRIPCFNPDPLVTKLTHYLGFLVSPIGLFLWIVVTCYGFLLLGQNWSEFYNNRVEALASTNLVWIAVTWLILKVVHEMAHSVVCKSYGGRVHTCGVLMLLMIPLPYVDVTSSWRFNNKWKRILTSAAGMLAEIFIAAIACYLWVNSQPGPLKFHSGNVIITATLHTLLFNINPLMRFDGYYMLADFLEIPNLATHGRQWLKGIFKWMYFGTKPTAVKETGFRGLAVRIYGVLAMLWFFTIAASLSLAASSMIEGFGLIVAIVSCILWAGMPLFTLGKFVAIGTKTEKPNRAWFAGAMTLTIALVACFLYLCPGPSVITAPVVIEHEPLSIVRSNASGFVHQLHVSNGDEVNEGDLLMTLENRELELELESLRIDLAISRLRVDNLLSEGSISQVQLENESIDAMLKRQRELESQVADLQVFAPRSGQVISRELDSMTGQYLQPGTELLSIANIGQVQAIGLVNQADAEWILDNPDSEVDLQLWGRYESELIPGRLTHVNPRARDDLPHEAFSASAGGPLAVVPRSQVESDAEEGNPEMMLTAPRVKLEIEILADNKSELYGGQSGVFFIRNRNENMGKYLLSGFQRFINENNFRTHGL